MPSDLKLLPSYDTPTNSNAIEVFNVRPRHPGFMDARIRACFDRHHVVRISHTRNQHVRLTGGTGAGICITTRARECGTPEELDDPGMAATMMRSRLPSEVNTRDGKWNWETVFPFNSSPYLE